MLFRGFLFACMIALGGAAQASAFGSDANQGEPQFLPVDQAFKLAYRVDKDNVINLHWDVEPHYYLYKKHFRFTLKNGDATLGEAVFDRDGDVKDDPNFGRVEIFHNSVDVTIPVTAQKA
ncbi:MAG TPA: protein-disulfide reductase DsbD domain-containing protein, partial [Pseudomonadales bacterium]|nr:protein-disulfide reductase DsbD domain-containing protein [Pseudomonadales bacterium]